MKQIKIIPDPLLMVIAIICIVAFQSYWLRQNYAREEKTLLLKATAAFRETIMQLQVAKLKLDGLKWNGKDSGNTNIKIILNSDEEAVNAHYSPKEEVISTINVIRDKLKDSMPFKKGRNAGIVIAMKSTTVRGSRDSMQFEISPSKTSKDTNTRTDTRASMQTLHEQRYTGSTYVGSNHE